MSRRRRLVAASGGGATRSAVPMLIGSLRNAEEGASSGRDGLQRGSIEGHHIAGEGRVVEIDGVLLAPGGDQPVEEVHQGCALGLVGLIFVDDDPAVAADRGAVFAGRV